MSIVMSHPHPSSTLGRALALLEVAAALAIVHVSYRAFRSFTTAGRWEGDQGLNYSPGLFMIAATLLLMLAHRSRPESIGITSRVSSGGLALGLTFGLLSAMGAACIVALGGFHIEPSKPPPDGLALIGALGEVLLAGVMLLSVRRGLWLYKRLPPPMCVATLALACAVPILLALRSGKPVGGATALVGELLLCSGLGEELFFRGYVQSRLNTVFGRPFSLLGTEFGAGLFVASALFGFIHVLNTVDYFHGRYEFAWAWGLMNFGAGLLLGLMRERTASVLPGAVAHGVTDILEQAPTFL